MATSTKKVGPAKKTAPTKKAAPMKKATPAKDAALTKKAAPTKKTAPPKDAELAQMATPPKRAASTKKAGQVKAAPGHPRPPAPIGRRGPSYRPMSSGPRHEAPNRFVVGGARQCFVLDVGVEAFHVRLHLPQLSSRKAQMLNGRARFYTDAGTIEITDAMQSWPSPDLTLPRFAGFTGRPLALMGATVNT